MSTRKASDSNLSGKKYNDASAGSTKIVDVADTPTIGTASVVSGETAINVPVTAAATGGVPTLFRAVSTPGSVEGTSATSPVKVSGLSTATAYTFVVRAETSTGVSAYSSASNSATIPAPPAPTTIDFLVLAGGGAGSYGNQSGNAGSTSSLGSITTVGGGVGTNQGGGGGGSGGGGGYSPYFGGGGQGGSGTAAQGSDGRAWNAGRNGGGALSNNGTGIESSITGTSTSYAYGGGGSGGPGYGGYGGTNGYGDQGGSGGAGGYRTSVGTSGRGSSAESQMSVSTGTTYNVVVGGGGSHSRGTANSAGAGLVVVRHDVSKALGTTTGSPTVTSDATYRYYVWTGDGSIRWT